MWLVRNYDDRLFLYEYKPIKRIHCGWQESKEDDGAEVEIDIYPNVKWSDTEPTEVELVIKNQKR